MPIVNILVTREGTIPGEKRTTREQKAAVYKGIADLLFTVMGKPHEDTTVIFHEHEIDHIGQGGLPLSNYRNQLALVRRVAPDLARRAFLQRSLFQEMGTPSTRLRGHQPPTWRATFAEPQSGKRCTRAYLP
ncbi:hypothetical protein NK8_66100 (plasmid) [Caballeronia sp. NK8]|uniref:tautomerase family protein n=1 Tax=Caballeronia sp. NK8 TaxID=140098 RepID=UPI001BB7E1EE|nr:hypothetical protein NK8_66100 [Caballeronia sp. NK8]